MVGYKVSDQSANTGNLYLTTIVRIKKYYATRITDKEASYADENI